MELEQIVEIGKVAGVIVGSAAALTTIYLGLVISGVKLMERVYAHNEARRHYNEQCSPEKNNILGGDPSAGSPTDTL